MKQTYSASFSAIIPQCPAQLIVVHLWFTLPGPPQPGHFIWVLDDKLAVVPLPGDDIMILFLPEQLQDEVPQLDLPGPGARLRLVSPVWECKPCNRENKESEGVSVGHWSTTTTTLNDDVESTLNRKKQ